MIRSNTGNIVTNAVQIGSVGLTTASGVLKHLGSADNALNNLTKDERKQLGEVRANKLRDEISRYQTGGENSLQHLTPEEQTDYRAKQAEDIKKYTYRQQEESEESIDTYMKDVDSIYTTNSPQVENIQSKLSNDREFLNDWSKPVNQDVIEDLINKGEI